MPVYVEEMTSEVGVISGDLPLSDAQIEKLVKIVVDRLDRRQRESRSIREATELRSQATPPIRSGK